MIALRDFLHSRWLALLHGFQSWPDSSAWLMSVLVMVIYGVLARWVGKRSGIFVKLDTPLPLKQKMLLIGRIIVHPAITEESLYRGLLLPPPSLSPIVPRDFLWYGLSLLLFVLAHPVNAWLLRRPARPVFTNPIFLLLVTLFGICVSLIYALSGSLWPPILFHGVVVYVWLTNYGGLTALYRSA